MGLGQSTAHRRIGLLGGSFDPVHLAHLALARQARQVLKLDEVWWIPAGRPWQKAGLGATPEQRLAMLKIALANDTGMRVIPLEIQRNGPTYTIDTLHELQTVAPESTTFIWLLGSDQLRNFCTWHRWQDIASLVDLAVAQRPGHSLEPPAELANWLRQQGRTLLQIPFEPLDISATAIRQKVRDGQDFQTLVPPAVAEYIQRHQLYSAGSA